MKHPSYFLFTNLIVVVKVSFLAVVIYYHYLKRKEPSNAKKVSSVLIMKEQIEFVYILLMSILLLINFNPWTTVSIDVETRILLFIYGIVILLTANYSTFFNQSIVKKMDSSLSSGTHQTQDTHPHNNSNNSYLLS
jgi:uncharacterized membrane protein YbjE (DUF340 family)